MKELQFQFPEPGNWGKFILTAVFPENGFIQSRRFTQDSIPADQSPVLEAAVTAIASMGEDWQASQVWARLGDDSVINNPAAQEGAVEVHEAVLLTVEAVNSAGGRRICTPSEYMQFVLADPAAVAFFRYFVDAEPVNS